MPVVWFAAVRDDVRILKIYTCGEGGNRKYCREVIRMAEAHGIPYQDKPIVEKDVAWLFDQMSCPVSIKGEAMSATP